MQQSRPSSFSPVPEQIYQVKCRYQESLSSFSHLVSIGHHKILLNCSDFPFTPGDSLSFPAKICPLLHTANEGAFDYTQYLKQKNVHFFFIPTDSICKTGYSANIITYFEAIRNRFIQKIDSLFPDTNHRVLIKALCLGYKKDLPPRTRQLFSDTGTIHLLAVSGLHTGAIYLFLLFFFRLLGINGKKFRLFIIPLLWVYAGITGLSPSVVRAACILSFITIGDAFARDYLPLNSIAASAFITLLINPFALYSVSMQMSYAAYSGITLFFPFLHQFVHKFPAFCRPLYSLFCISLAAQLTTLPLSLYYFHGFCLNSILFNLLLIPLITLLLYLSVFLLLLPLCIGIYAGIGIQFFCHFIFLLLQGFQPISLYINGLYPTFIQVMLYYFLFIIATFFLLKRKKILLRSLIGITSVLLLYSCWNRYQLSNKQEIVIFHLYRHSCILLNYHTHYCYLKKKISDKHLKQIRPYIDKNHLKHLLPGEAFLHPLFSYREQTFSYKNDTIYMIDSSSHTLPVNGTLIITGNRRPPSFPLQEKISWKEVILDGSNQAKCIREWEKFCNNRQIPLRKTEDYGSICLRLK